METKQLKQQKAGANLLKLEIAALKRENKRLRADYAKIQYVSKVRIEKLIKDKELLQDKLIDSLKENIVQKLEYSSYLQNEFKELTQIKAQMKHEEKVKTESAPVKYIISPIVHSFNLN